VQSERSSGPSRPKNASYQLLRTFDVRHALVGLSQPGAHQFEQLEAHFRPLLQEGDDIAPLEDDQFAFRKRGRIRRALLAIEERNLAEEFAGRQIGQDDSLSPWGPAATRVRCR
jgi:hypothetical protein